MVSQNFSNAHAPRQRAAIERMNSNVCWQNVLGIQISGSILEHIRCGRYNTLN